MQTFLPYADFRKSLESLDTKRLGKQRVEALQLLNALTGKSRGWTNHPAAIMWRGHERCLQHYMNEAIDVWVERGFRNSMEQVPGVARAPRPVWLGEEDFHLSHQSNLIRKDPAFYGPRFPGVPGDLPYVWPTNQSPKRRSTT